MRHYHIEEPFLCIKSTMLGWTVSPNCDPEQVELCSEMIIGDVTFLPDLNSIFDELHRRGANEATILKLRQQMHRQPA